MTTEKTEDYALQGRQYLWGKLSWVDYIVGGNAEELMRTRDNWQRRNSFDEWRVIHRAIEITVIDSAESESRND